MKRNMLYVVGIALSVGLGLVVGEFIGLSLETTSSHYEASFLDVSLRGIICVITASCFRSAFLRGSPR